MSRMRQLATVLLAATRGRVTYVHTSGATLHAEDMARAMSAWRVR